MHDVVANFWQLYSIYTSISPSRHTICIPLHRIHRNTLRYRDSVLSIHRIHRRQLLLTAMGIAPVVYLLTASDGRCCASAFRVV